jgi:hypothetical protein
MTSLIYSNVRIYRLAMNLLYGGAYRERFSRVIDVIGGGVKSVCDLCFGDTLLAEWCRENDVTWTGIDLNESFCARARRLGFDAINGDLFSAELPRADVYVMAGSLYHFQDRLPELFETVWQRTSRFIISEPVQNLSSRPGLLGWYARRSANPGDGHATFRYNENTLQRALGKMREIHGFSLRVVSVERDLIAELDRPPASAALGGGVAAV